MLQWSCVWGAFRDKFMDEKRTVDAKTLEMCGRKRSSAWWLLSCLDCAYTLYSLIEISGFHPKTGCSYYCSFADYLAQIPLEISSLISRAWHRTKKKQLQCLAGGNYSGVFWMRGQILHSLNRDANHWRIVKELLTVQHLNITNV